MWIMVVMVWVSQALLDTAMNANAFNLIVDGAAYLE
jgi:hypothetical protein